ncbi:hypothetical protein [Luteolibacter sp. Populi]|uniref:hypothetical protein n=1 Tax=Luteolibacter sp. Populi TaxID=3230487 RepID=UPI003467DABD
MNKIWITAGGALIAIGAAVFFLNQDPAPDGPGTGGSTLPGTGETAPGSGQSPEGRRLRKEGQEAKEADSKAATDLQLLWARGDEKEVLDAIDKVGDYKKAEEWRAVGSVLIQKARSEGRDEVIRYLLATGDAAPMSIQLAMYAAALDNKAEGVKSLARLELQNLTGQVFNSEEEAKEWLKAHPPEEEAEEEE